MRIPLLESIEFSALKADDTLTVYGVRFSEENQFIVVPSGASYGLPHFIPASNARLLDARVSRHWVLRPAEHLSEFRTARSSLLTVSDWARAPYFYNQLVESEGDAWSAWRAWMEKMDFEFSEPGLPNSSYLEDGWWMCPSCDDAFMHPEPRDEVARCPTCWTKQTTLRQVGV